MFSSSFFKQRNSWLSVVWYLFLCNCSWSARAIEMLFFHKKTNCLGWEPHFWFREAHGFLTALLMIIINIYYMVQLFLVFKTEQNKTKQSSFAKENTALEKKKLQTRKWLTLRRKLHLQCCYPVFLVIRTWKEKHPLSIPVSLWKMMSFPFCRYCNLYLLFSSCWCQRPREKEKDMECRAWSFSAVAKGKTI